MSENRDSETGQFTTGAAEPLTGTASVEESQGYKSMPAPAEPEIAEQSIEEAVASQQAGRAAAEPDQTVHEIAYRQSDGSITDPSLTVTQERATKDNADYHASQRETAERHLSAEFRAEVLKQRAELVAAAPETAETLGIDANETIARAVAENPELVADQPAEPTEATQQSDAFDGIQGLEPELKEVLKKSPQARQFLESNAAETDRAVETFKTAANHAQTFGQGALLAIAPELAQVPVERWAEAVQIIAQSDPVKGQMLGKTLSNVAALNERQQLFEHYQRDQQRQGFETYRAQQNEIINKAHQLTYAQKAEFAEDLTNHVAKFGVTRENIVQAMETNPLLHNAAFQDLVYKGIQFEKMQKAAKATPTRQLPPVARPGTAPPVTRGSDSTIRSLERQLGAATTQQSQLKIAAKLLAAKRAG
jgi:hypothetical protein